MRAQSAVPHALDDLAQLGAIGLDEEAEGRAATQVSSSHGGRRWSKSRIWAVDKGYDGAVRTNLLMRGILRN